MTGIPDDGAAGAGLTWFAMQRLPPLLAAFEKEIAGVRDARDIEFIHRMRVASRRLRAALPLFRPCFAKKQYARWMLEIGAITRALGEARDLDVQIAFLVKFRKKRTASLKTGDPAAAPGPGPLDPAVGYLLQDLRKRRAGAQDHVIAALDGLEQSGTVAGMQAAFALLAPPGRRTPARALANGIPAMAAFRIGSRLAAMRSYEPWVTHADAVAEHHAMRIAAKKLRYTLEVYGPVYRRGLIRPHRRVKKIQEILGDLHDCDVWIDGVTRLLLRERSRLRSPGTGKRPDTATLASLRLFLQDRERERTRIHRQFMRFWQSLARQGAWEELSRTLFSGRKRRFIPAQKFREEEAARAVEVMAATYPEGLSHHRTVTRLALSIFDCLKADYTLTPHDRALLACAGMVHDIGWTGGQKRHQERSARWIFSDESLPLDLADRSITGLLALAHRGRAEIDTHPLFLLLPHERRNTVLLLAGILRVADGLDYLHTGAVQDVRCMLREREIVLEIVSPAGALPEKERARIKSGLFVQASGRELVIP